MYLLNLCCSSELKSEELRFELYHGFNALSHVLRQFLIFTEISIFYRFFIKKSNNSFSIFFNTSLRLFDFQHLLQVILEITSYLR